MPYRSTGPWPASVVQIAEHRHAAARRCPTPAAAPPRSARAHDGSAAIRPHTVGTPKYERAAGRGVGRRRRASGVDAAAMPARSAPSTPEHQSVHVEQRQPVDQHVVGRPGPGVAQPVQAGVDRAVRQHRPLGRPGRARGVHEQRRCRRSRIVHDGGRRPRGASATSDAAPGHRAGVGRADARAPVARSPAVPATRSRRPTGRPTIATTVSSVRAGVDRDVRAPCTRSATAAAAASSCSPSSVTPSTVTCGGSAGTSGMASR